MVEGTALEMRHTRKSIGGSNPPLSASLPQTEILSDLRVAEMGRHLRGSSDRNSPKPLTAPQGTDSDAADPVQLFDPRNSYIWRCRRRPRRSGVEGPRNRSQNREGQKLSRETVERAPNVSA